MTMLDLHTIEVPLPGPADLAMSLEGFRRWGDDGLDRWEGQRLLRTVRVGEEVVPFLARSIGTVDEPFLRVTFAGASHEDAVIRAARTTVIPAPPSFDRLLEIDPVVADLNRRHPGLREIRQIDLLAALVRCISAQQVNLRWAATTRRRLAETFGHRHDLDGHMVYSLDAARLAAADPAEIRSLQFTTRKAEYLVGVAEAVASGRLRADDLAQRPDEEVIARLTALRGIGLWTAEWILARFLGRPRVAAGDLGVRKVVGQAYLEGAMPDEATVRRLTAHWGEGAGVAQTLLLAGYQPAAKQSPGTG